MKNHLVTLPKFSIMDTTLLNRITANHAVLTGKPVVRGMRISVEQIIKMLARGISNAAIIEEFPLLEEDDIKACLLFAAKKISNEEEMAA
jgi:uncharacterized protein (DUF433 family)